MAGTETALERVQESRLRNLHTAFPGKVQSYDPAKRTADIIPMLVPVIPGADPEDDEDLEDPLPVLMAVPILFPRAGGATIEFDVVAGDTVLVVVCERDIKRWLATGERGQPTVHSLHGLNGAVAYPGLVPSNAPAPTFTVAMKSTRMEVGGASDAAALASRVDQMSQDIALAFSTFIPGSGGASFPDPYVHGGTSASQRLKLGG